MRRLEYAGRGQILDAATKNIVSPKRIVFEYNILSEAVSNASPKPFAMPHFADAASAQSPEKGRIS